MAKRVNIEDLAGNGLRVGTPHITVRYGIDTTDTELIKSKVKHMFPFYISFGKTKSFPPSIYSDEVSPLIVSVHSPQLVALNETIDSSLPVIPANFPYVPHMTLAYIDTNQISKYLDMDLMQGLEFIAKELTIVHQDESEKTISFV